jgi:hypothetical protein
MHLTRRKRVNSRLCARQPPFTDTATGRRRKKKRIRNEPHVRDVLNQVAVMGEPVEGPRWREKLRARTKSAFANLCQERWDE